MRLYLKVFSTTVLVSALGAAVPAWSAGNHAGGHSHGSDSQAIGQPGQASQVTRTLELAMSDSMRFSPANITVKAGETIKFVLNNIGKLKHEFVLGTDKELKEHYQQMLKFPEMEHDEPNMVTVAPGKTGVVIWTFTQAGKVDFACLLPGHYGAGMKGSVAVSAAK
ncbi:MAG: hypothetical protein CK528_06105 [Alcaligenaceae bacterium]|nr:MAG: hypothetical protein CK528_06105 [Alcaligenaceae bacterium]